MHADFIDSNLFVYLFDHTDDRRRGIAREIVERGIAEGTDAIAFFDTVLSPLWRVYPSGDLYRRAVEIQVRYRFGFYDSLIVAAALEGGCTRLLSEDLQAGQSIETLTVENPFV
jgi:predicted nucleic acid-binding protein